MIDGSSDGLTSLYLLVLLVVRQILVELPLCLIVGASLVRLLVSLDTVLNVEVAEHGEVSLLGPPVLRNLLEEAEL